MVTLCSMQEHRKTDFIPFDFDPNGWVMNPRSVIVLTMQVRLVIVYRTEHILHKDASARIDCSTSRQQTGVSGLGPYLVGKRRDSFFFARTTIAGGVGSAASMQGSRGSRSAGRSCVQELT